MTLLRQLIICIMLLFLMTFVGNMLVSIVNARHYLQEQMQVHAQDTATSLGLSLSTATEQGDTALIESMLDVIFDRGYYSQIVFNDLNGNKILERKQPNGDIGAPRWFAALVKLSAPEGRAEVVSGWDRLGELTVVAHSGYAYRNLWRIVKEQYWWISFVTVMACLLGALAIRVLFQPLRRVVTQAEAICNRDFRIQKELPRTKEFRRVVEAMNRLSSKMKVLFDQQVDLTESLYAQARLDTLTKLSNRRDFDARYNALMHSEEGESSASLILLQVKDFGHYNDLYGRNAGDELLIDIANKLTETFEGIANVILARRAGADFTAFLPQVSLSEAEEILDSLFVELVMSAPFNQLEMGCTLHIGMVYTPQVSVDPQLLQRADMALRAAQQRGPSCYQIYHQNNIGEDDTTPVKDAVEWRQILQQVLVDKSLILHFQPVWRFDPAELMHYEVLSRIEVEGQLVTAGVFLPMAERYGLLEEFDQLVIDLLIEGHLSLDDSVYSVNLSLQSIQSEQFIKQLVLQFETQKTLANKLVLEVPEYIVRVAELQLRKLTALLVPLGIRFSIDHFGSGAAAFSYLESLDVHFLKINRSYVEDIHINADNRFFIRSVEQIAHSKDICLLAEGVETVEEWQSLQMLKIGGAQGYFLGRPSADLATDLPE